MNIDYHLGCPLIYPMYGINGDIVSYLLVPSWIPKDTPPDEIYPKRWEFID
jgi:hypothetical protein